MTLFLQVANVVYSKITMNNSLIVPQPLKFYVDQMEEDHLDEVILPNLAVVVVVVVVHGVVAGYDADVGAAAAVDKGVVGPVDYVVGAVDYEDVDDEANVVANVDAVYAAAAVDDVGVPAVIEDVRLPR
mmetsp:Transcript_24144/g.33982  ORF Transcript_24144/g.33982 Transcript_24144/m.33982 type:complete len:129 (-) Transcript_24144:101-487(-)